MATLHIIRHGTSTPPGTAEQSTDTDVFYNNACRAQAVVDAVMLKATVGRAPTEPLPESLLVEDADLARTAPRDGAPHEAL